MKKKITIIISVIFFFIIWEVIASYTNSDIVFPSLSETFRSVYFLLKYQTFWTALLFSFLRVFISFIISIVLGFFLGFYSGLSENFHNFLIFPLSLIRSTPVVALIMVLIFWFPSKVLPSFCAILMTLPVITDSVSNAVINTDKKLLEMSIVFDFSFLTKFRGIYYPNIKPYFYATSKTVFSQSWKVVAAGEILSLPHSALGTLISDNRTLLETPKVFALTILLSVICIFSEKIIFILFDLFSDCIKKHFYQSRIKSFEFTNTASESVFTVQQSESKIYIQNLSFSYSSKPINKEIFNNFSISFEKNKITAILSHTGRGKTTLLNLLSDIIPQNKYSGKISCPKVSYIFQDTRLLPGVSVIDNIAFPLFSKMTKKNAYKTSFHYLKKIGLYERAFDFPENLSGGEKQKLQTARAFSFPSEVILMDEGTNSLDEISKKIIWDSINKILSEKPRTLIFVTHDESEAKTFADTIIRI